MYVIADNNKKQCSIFNIMHITYTEFTCVQGINENWNLWNKHHGSFKIMTTKNCIYPNYHISHLSKPDLQNSLHSTLKFILVHRFHSHTNTHIRIHVTDLHSVVVHLTRVCTCMHVRHILPLCQNVVVLMFSQELSFQFLSTDELCFCDLFSISELLAR